MTSKNLEVNNYLPTDIVPPDKQHLHIVQMLKKLNPTPIAGCKDLEIQLQVQNLVHFEHLFGFLTKSKDKNYLILI